MKKVLMIVGIIALAAISVYVVVNSFRHHDNPWTGSGGTPVEEVTPMPTPTPTP
jgi:hypothetical protein